ncbi:hypothetical protein PAHAL_8G187000 [Panicum hallii]|jgi:hypothetical protein|uniref:Uncharacterized protein n=1 Tax=Panicum hallii TaxID=206008 RepID=A0A2T8I9B9_9POAL|nr:hypothetical protein PAHAL_8G187000 [Panicum hallii]
MLRRGRVDKTKARALVPPVPKHPVLEPDHLVFLGILGNRIQNLHLKEQGEAERQGPID